VQAYYFENDVDNDSDTETFVAVKAEIDNWRWAGVPFYLRTGKRMARKRSEIIITFKQVPHMLFTKGEVNRLVIRLQPDEGLQLNLMAKTPGLDRHGIRLREIPLDLGLANAFSEYRRRIAYERLLLDLIEGDPTLFVRRDEVEEAWRWIDGVADAWKDAGMAPKPYAAGSWGPSGAFALIERSERAWMD